MKRNELTLFDVGDPCVGLSPLVIMKCELNEEFIKQMDEDKTLIEFRDRLAKLCAEYWQPETYYETYMERDEDWRKAEVENGQLLINE